MPAPAVAAIVLPTGRDLDVEDRPMETILTHGDDFQDPEALLVHEWRIEQLRRLGLRLRAAERFADLVDWHAVADLVERGCAPDLALEIAR